MPESWTSTECSPSRSSRPSLIANTSAKSAATSSSTTVESRPGLKLRTSICSCHTLPTCRRRTTSRLPSEMPVNAHRPTKVAVSATSCWTASGSITMPPIRRWARLSTRMSAKYTPWAGFESKSPDLLLRQNVCPSTSVTSDVGSPSAVGDPARTHGLGVVAGAVVRVIPPIVQVAAPDLRQAARASSTTRGAGRSEKVRGRRVSHHRATNKEPSMTTAAITPSTQHAHTQHASARRDGVFVGVRSMAPMLLAYSPYALGDRLCRRPHRRPRGRMVRKLDHLRRQRPPRGAQGHQRGRLRDGDRGGAARQHQAARLQRIDRPSVAGATRLVPSGRCCLSHRSDLGARRPARGHGRVAGGATAVLPRSRA